jgi:ApaG protein
VETVQLTSRHWVIKEGFNKVNHVVGDGVVGQKPIMRPGEKFDYNSFCPLNTPTGSMQGSFQMKTEKGETFEALIDEFSLRDRDLVN